MVHHGERQESKLRVRPQIATYDRMTSMAAKACMSITSQTNAELKSSFKTDWRNGVITSHGQPFAAWEINAERAVITLAVIAAHKDEVKRNVENKIYELLYPQKESRPRTSPLGGKHDKDAFEVASDPYLSEQLNALNVPCFPFCVEVVELHSRKRE
eukprot:1199497-Amphidinium_carterae.1